MGNLAFLQPTFLAAFAAIAIPIIIHLIYRRKAIRWRFAAFEFLLRSQRRVARRLQIKQLILLLLRCLLYALVAFAFAKPFFQRAQGASPTQPKAIVVVVDDSMSMRYREKGKQTLFALAKEKATAMIKQLAGGDRVALLRGSRMLRVAPHEQKELTLDKNSAIQKLSKWKPSFRSTDLPTALRRAAVALQNVKGYQPQIAVFSDFARHAFDGSDTPKLPPLPPVKLFPVQAKEPSNRAIVQLEMRPAAFAGADAYRLTVTVRNYGKKAIRELPIKLRLNAQDRVRGFIKKLNPESTALKNFIVRLRRAGFYKGYVEIGKDGLHTDNRRYFALRARQRPKVLLINGDPRTIPYLDELFYLERALRDPRAPFSLKVVHASSRLPDPTGFQAIYLCNVGEVSMSWRSKLLNYVRNGGGLFISMGDQINPARYNRLFGPLLPRYLRGVALAAQRPDGTGIALQRNFGKLKGDHPIFRRLYREGFLFQSARIVRLMLVEPRRAKQEGKILWNYSHGPPALLERKFGKGRVLLYTTTMDRDWTNASIRPFFLPWIHQVTAYLSGGSRFLKAESLLVDQNARILQVPGEGPIQAIAPRGNAIWIRPAQKGYIFPGAPTPGLYRLERNGKRLSMLPQTVNVDPRETDPTPLSAKQLASIGSVAKTRSLGAVLNQQSESFWPMLFFLLIFVFAAEAFVLRYL